MNNLLLQFLCVIGEWGGGFETEFKLNDFLMSFP